jgi:hypothetical protein
MQAAPPLARRSAPVPAQAADIRDEPVTVTIERLELKAAPPTREPRRQRPARRASLDEYVALSRRTGAT